MTKKVTNNLYVAWDDRSAEEKAEEKKAEQEHANIWNKIEKAQFVEVSGGFAYDGTLALLPGGIAQTASNLIGGMMQTFLPLVNWKVEVTHEEGKEVQPADSTIKYPHTLVKVIVRFIGPDYQGAAEVYSFPDPNFVLDYQQ